MRRGRRGVVPTGRRRPPMSRGERKRGVATTTNRRRLLLAATPITEEHVLVAHRCCTSHENQENWNNNNCNNESGTEGIKRTVSVLNFCWFIFLVDSLQTFGGRQSLGCESLGKILWFDFCNRFIAISQWNWRLVEDLTLKLLQINFESTVSRSSAS